MSDSASNSCNDTPEFNGLLQFSSALSPNRYLNAPDRKREGRFHPDRGFNLSNDDVKHFRKELRHQFVDYVSGFTMERCYDKAEWKRDGAIHSWLGRDSRHAAICLPPEFYETERNSYPKLLWWGGSQACDVDFETYVRVQRSAGVDSGPVSRPVIHPDDMDCNDYLLSENSIVQDDLVALQRFLAWLYAQRRSRLFASDLSERIYNIWLPPGLIQSQNQRERSFALLPFVTRVRRPFRPDFRDTVTLSIILAPVDIANSRGRGPREMTRSEICDVLQAMDGGSTHAAKEAMEPYELLPSPLSRYVEQLRGSDLKTASVLAGRAMDATPESPVSRGTIRQWTELLFTAIEEPIFPGLTEHKLPDAVLKSARH